MERAEELFRHYYNKTASPAEVTELMQLVKNLSPTELGEMITRSGEELNDTGGALSSEKADSILEYILTHQPVATPAPVRLLKKWWRYAAAASIVLVLSLGIYFYRHSGTPTTTIAQGGDVNPGKHKARLTLADGSTIVLDSTLSGGLAKQGSTSVIKKGNELVYDPGADSGAIMYNTLFTANGETYTLTLADGTAVFLNAASSIRFPVSFPGSERRIEITGEAYFKVTKNPAQPFIVSVNGMDVRALGTEFNINAYADEPAITTTLVEGSVKVSQPSVNNDFVILKPSQQSRVDENGHLQAFADANVNEAIAWKEGKFYFESADLETIMRQFARWYDIEVQYEGQATKEKFFIIMNRDITLFTVLRSLQANGIKFRMEGKKLFVRSA